MFNFETYLDKYRRVPRWKIVRVGRRASQRVSAYATLGVNEFRQIKSKTLKFRVLWVGILVNIALRRLWDFYPGEPENVEPGEFDFARFGMTFRRCLCCRPSYLFFKPSRKALSAAKKVNYQVRPCRRYGCPFCFSRRVASSFRRVKLQVNKFLAKEDGCAPAYLCYRAYTEHVMAVGFSGVTGSSRDDVLNLSHLLRAKIQSHRAVYNKVKRKVCNGSLGGLWGVYAWPVSDGWIVETRQLLLLPVGKKPQDLPFPTRIKRSRKKREIRYCSRVKDFDSFSEQFESIFCLFWQYPKGLLIGYPELVAAVFWATLGSRMFRSFGLFSGAACSSRFVKKKAVIT